MFKSIKSSEFTNVINSIYDIYKPLFLVKDTPFLHCSIITIRLSFLAYFFNFLRDISETSFIQIISIFLKVCFVKLFKHDIIYFPTLYTGTKIKSSFFNF